MRITLDRTKWEQIGRKAGWAKMSAAERQKTTRIGYIFESPEEFLEKLNEWAPQVTEGVEQSKIGETLFWELQDWLDDNVFESQDDTGSGTPQFHVSVELNPDGTCKLTQLQ
jgi:hypothetical protein